MKHLKNIKASIFGKIRGIKKIIRAKIVAKRPRKTVIVPLLTIGREYHSPGQTAPLRGHCGAMSPTRTAYATSVLRNKNEYTRDSNGSIRVKGVA